MAIIKKHCPDKKIIDEEMWPLVEALHKLGLIPISSCSGHGDGLAQIAFDITQVDVLASKSVLSLNWKRRKNG